ncbi:MAG: transglutaminaseTgpA domain-containing protein [Gemmataceae bacterium]
MNLVWAALRIAQANDQPGMSSTNLQFVLVALFGTLLLTLIPAKLARREQHVGDYWALYAMALVAVCLGGAMAEDPVSFLLMACYATVAVWSLCLFQFQRATGAVSPLPTRPVPMSITGILCDPQSRSCAKPALKLSLLAAAIAIPLYLLTPRSPGEKLEFGKSRVEIGFSASQMVDLNTTGNLENNPAPAFEVTLETVNGLIPQLPEEQLWRRPSAAAVLEGNVGK